MHKNCLWRASAAGVRVRRKSMSEKIYPVQKPVQSHALIDKAKYEKWHEESVEKSG